MGGHHVGAIIDTETTGLSGNDELIEIGIVLFMFNKSKGNKIKVLEEYCGLREPICPIHPGARAVHGLTEEDLLGERLDEKRISEMFNTSQMLIAHNASFDRRYVAKLFPEVISKYWYCTMNGIAWRAKGFFSNSLKHLLQTHEIKIERSHRALDDAKGILDILSRVDITTGRHYLSELLKSNPLSRYEPIDYAEEIQPVYYEEVFQGEELMAPSEKHFKDEFLNNPELWSSMLEWAEETNSLTSSERIFIWNVFTIMEDESYLKPEGIISAEKIAGKAFKLGFNFGDLEIIEVESEMRTLEVSNAVWDEIAKRGKFGETVDDVLRREFSIDERKF